MEKNPSQNVVGITKMFWFTKFINTNMKKIWFNVYPYRKVQEIIIKSMWINTLAWLTNSQLTRNRYIEFKLRQRVVPYYSVLLRFIWDINSNLDPGDRRDMNEASTAIYNRMAFFQSVWIHHHCVQVENTEINFKVT